MKSKKLDRSPMQYRFWMKRINPNTGKEYTEEEAKYHIKTFRKSNLEYWLIRGYSYNEAIELRRKHQTDSFNVAKQISKDHPEWQTTRIEYWLKKGYSEKEAREKLSERQKTFTLEKCIAKYGEEEGKRIFNDRQIRWQHTLNSKSKEELETLKKKRNSFRYFENPNIERNSDFFEKWKKICDLRHLKYFDTIEKYKSFVLNDYLETCPSISSENIDYYFSKVIQEVYYKVLNISVNEIKEWILKDLSYLGTDNKAYLCYWGNNKCCYHLIVKEGILASLSEIVFYKLCKKYDILNIEINKLYPNSRMKFDFKINDYFIEISNTMKGNETYLAKQKYKQETFGSIILLDIKEFEPFIQKVLVEKDEKAIKYYLTRPL